MCGKDVQKYARCCQYKENATFDPFVSRNWSKIRIFDDSGKPRGHFCLAEEKRPFGVKNYVTISTQTYI